MKAHVAVVGSINADLSLTCTQLPAQGETVLAREVRRSPGGKGANQAVASARAGGVDTTMIGAVGDDADGAEMVRHLAVAGVHTCCVTAHAGQPTGLAVISVGQSGENTIVVAPGANSSLTMNESAVGAIAGAEVLLAQLEVPQSVVAAAARERRAGVPFLLNAAPAATLTRELADEVDLLIVNEHEAAVIAGADSSEEALEILARQFPAVLVTLGERGSVLRRAGNQDVRVCAPVVSAVDTTAAGDTFCGVLAASLAGARPIEDSMRMATAAAALAVQRRGAQESVPSLEQTQSEAARARVKTA